MTSVRRLVLTGHGDDTRLVLSAEPGPTRRLHVVLHGLRAFLDEPRPAQAPLRVWRDWILLATVLAGPALEVVLVEDRRALGEALAVSVVITATLLWRRTHSLAAVVVGLGTLNVYDVGRIARRKPRNSSSSPKTVLNRNRNRATARLNQPHEPANRSVTGRIGAGGRREVDGDQQALGDPGCRVDVQPDLPPLAVRTVVVRRTRQEGGRPVARRRRHHGGARAGAGARGGAGAGSAVPVAGASRQGQDQAADRRHARRELRR